MISSVRMIATPISDSPAISPLDTGTVQVSAVFGDVRATSHATKWG